jgi:hypothetical protein
MAKTIVVLADGETWTLAHNCSIMIISDEEFEAFNDGELLIVELNPLSELFLTDETK